MHDYERAMPLVAGGATAAMLVNQLWLPVGAFVLVFGCALLIRTFFRRGKSPLDPS